MRFHLIAAATTLGAVVANADSSSSATVDPHTAGRERYERKLETLNREQDQRRAQRDSGGTQTVGSGGNSYGGNGGQQSSEGKGGSGAGDSGGLEGNGAGGGSDALQNMGGSMGVSVTTGPGGYAGGTNTNWYHGGGPDGGYNGPPYPDAAPGDYDIRFNKVPFNDNYDANNSIFPLVRTSFPIKEPLVEILKTQTSCPSVISLDDHEVLLDVMDLIENGHGMRGFPTHATSDNDSDFWKHFQHVLVIQITRRGNEDADAKTTIGMPLPDIWENYSLKMVADAVHDEYPNYHQSRNLADMLSKGGVSIDNTVIPKRSRAQFLRGPIMMADMNTWATGLIGPHSFAAKYAAGRSRPEEIFWAIYQTQIPLADLPSAVRNAYTNLLNTFPNQLVDGAPSVTAYPEGSPGHPSWPAMHSAASQTSFWLSVVLDLTPHQLCQARLVDYAVAYARTVAGVHYPDDNIDGLNLGQAVLIELLSDYLVGKYGSDRAAVEAKIEQMKYDWNDFNAYKPCPFDPNYS